jgi:hypothetical protein
MKEMGPTDTQSREAWLKEMNQKEASLKEDMRRQSDQRYKDNGGTGKRRNWEQEK